MPLTSSASPPIRSDMVLFLRRLDRLLHRSLAQAEALGAQRRLADAESAAQAAQVRALRYQVNPHFLFNTLNSLSSLVMTGRPDRAEAMLLALSTFSAPACRWIQRGRHTGRRDRSPATLSRYREGALSRPPSCRNRRSRGARVGAAARADPSADRRKCDQIRRVQKPKGGGHPDRSAASRRRTDGARRQQSPEDMAARTSCRPRRTKAPGLASPMSASASRRASAAEPNCRFGPMTGGGYKVSLTMPVETNG